MSNASSRVSTAPVPSVYGSNSRTLPHATVRVGAAASLMSTWNAFVPVSLAEVFPRAKGPIPAVSHTTGQDGRWDVVGRNRFVHLKDGSVVREEITISQPPDTAQLGSASAQFGYRVSEFSGPIGYLATEAHGVWLFRSDGPARTEIEWTYTFVPKGRLRSLPLRLVMKFFWLAYMRDGIENVRRIVER